MVLHFPKGEWAVEGRFAPDSDIEIQNSQLYIKTEQHFNSQFVDQDNILAYIAAYYISALPPPPPYKEDGRVVGTTKQILRK